MQTIHQLLKETVIKKKGSNYTISCTMPIFFLLLWQMPGKYFGNKGSRLQLYYSYQISCYAGKNQIFELSSIENLYSRIQLFKLFLESSNCYWILYNVSHIQGAICKFSWRIKWNISITACIPNLEKYGQYRVAEGKEQNLLMTSR